MPGHRVAAVAIETQPRSHERLAQLGGVVHAERIPGLRDDRVGERVVGVVEGEQTRHGDHSFVHLPPLGVPRDLVVQDVEETVGPGEPTRSVVDPGAVRQVRASVAEGKVAELDVVSTVEQRTLQREAHALDSTRESNRCSRVLVRDLRSCAARWWRSGPGPTRSCTHSTTSARRFWSRSAPPAWVTRPRSRSRAARHLSAVRLCAGAGRADGARHLAVGMPRRSQP